MRFEPMPAASRVLNSIIIAYHLANYRYRNKNTQRLIWSWCPSRCVALLQNKMYSCTTSPEACFFLNDSFITKWILFPSKRNRHLLRLNRWPFMRWPCCPINQSLDKYLVATERMSLIQIDRLDSLQASKSECFVAATRFGSIFCPRWLWRSSISAGCQNDSDKKHSRCDLGTLFTGLDVWKTSMVFVVLSSSTRWVRSTIKLLYCPLTKQWSAVNKSQQHQEKISWECRELNLGHLGAKQECYQLCYAAYQKTSMCVLKQPTVSL